VLTLGPDPTGLDVEQERALGSALNAAILARHRSVESAQLLSRITRAAGPLLDARTRKGIPYTFTLMDSDSANIFSHPGGFIYASMGLLNLVASDAELQFVLAREIAHVDLKHAATEMAREGSGESNLVHRAYRQIAQGYADEQEFAADAWAYRQLRKLGRSRRECLGFLRRLVPHVDRRGGVGGPMPSNIPPSSDLEPIEHHWLTGPPPADRLERLMREPARAQ
jgi:predicted Zn-dependent protease